MKKENIKKLQIIAWIMGFIALGLLIYGIFTLNINDGEYDYCVEWLGLNSGILERSNMIYNCYDLTTQTFNCDYDIKRDGILEVKPIINITYDKDNVITSITYDAPNYFNCTRWLKSKEVKNG